ncbi:DUF4188 domain-containing protein [Bacillus sp. NEB1478]|uniref:DUF4188 domain-containing protein n=1 Tax=Bacillus sp. NEB1478 TaxID=3073816 RepID=UPI002872DDED|nr:DUF4188 domain-containing protein [Bacillus sp. NEB1478]WNB91046.1 DUF4188 domain-containing protein [Bacillus sp. NEB1478]
MKKIFKGRYMADTDENFVLFIIGMRVNKILSFSKWIPVFKAMGPMIRELYQNPQLGFLHTEFLFNWRGVTLIQYWRSFEQLEAYAHGKTHLKAWKDFNKKIGDDGSVGIYHESYNIVNKGAEAIYSNMPKFGLAKAYSLVPVTKNTNSARERIKS